MQKPAPSRVTLPTQSLLEGKPYVPASSTDIRATFARIIKQQRQHLKAVKQRGCADTTVALACAIAGAAYLFMAAADWLPGAK